MWKAASLALVFFAVGRAEVHTLTLRQAVVLAEKQNPDVALARFEEEKARAGIRIARDPFLPRLIVGSGLAYSNGFPMSIEGSAPSIVQAHAVQDIFNRSQSLLVAQAKEDARGAGVAVGVKQDEVAYRTAALYLDAERALRIGALARKAIDSPSCRCWTRCELRCRRAAPSRWRRNRRNSGWRARASWPPTSRTMRPPRNLTGRRPRLPRRGSRPSGDRGARRAAATGIARAGPSIGAGIQ